MPAKNILVAASAGGSEPSDLNFNRTVLLLNGNGNQGANNLYNSGPTKYLAFSDNSNNNFPITVNGDAYGTNISPYQANYSNLFTGTSGLRVDPQTFSGNFTWECWYYPTALGSGVGSNYSVVFGMGSASVQNIQLYVDNDGSVKYYNGSATLISTAAGIVTAGRWNHIALCRNGTTTTLYVDGVSRGSGTESNTKYINSVGNFLPDQANYGVRGYITNFRATTTAEYTSNFTPPTAPLQAISGTLLLLSQANRFTDNSLNPKAVTITGTVTVSTFQPFALAVNDYGSGFFDGSGDFLDVPDNPALEIGSNSFCIEAWINPSALPTLGGERNILAKWITASRSFAFLYLNASGTMTLRLAYSLDGSTTQGISQAAPIVANAWQHIAVTRDGTTARFFLNGVQQGSNQTLSGTFWNNTEVLTVGRFGTGGGSQFDGYLSDLRFVVGSPVYTSNFTPPTAPLTAITNTQLLTCQYSGSVRNVGFIDESQNYFPISRVGSSTAPGTFSPFSVAPGMWSNWFNGSTGFLFMNTSTALTPGTSAFTLELWVYYTPVGSTTHTIISRTMNSGFPLLGYVLETSNGNLRFGIDSSTSSGTISTSTPLPLNQWSHIAVVREGTGTNQAKMYLNGVQIGQSTMAENLNQSTQFRIGATNAGGGHFPGYISNVRFVKGRAVYTGAFTPPAEPLGVTSGGTNPPQGTETSLLTCQSNRFVDNAVTPNTLSISGEVRVRPFSLFAPNSAYTPAANGGSGYFDGAGDYIRVGTVGNAAFSFGSGNFTIEMFVYHNQLKNYSGLIGEMLGSSTNTIAMYTYASGAVGVDLLSGLGQAMAAPAGTAVAFAWQHYALVRNGNVTTLYVDGVSRATYTSSANMGLGQTAGFILASANGWSDLNGHISGVRILKGVAQYTANFTPPTAPPLPTTNTSFLCNFTNAGILDQTGKNVLTSVGNTQIDTNVVKYGTGSIKFDGTGDWLILQDNPDLQLGDLPFTIEFWARPTSLTTAHYFVSKGASTTGWAVWTTSGGQPRFDFGSTQFSSNATLLVNNWYHIAVVRTGTGTNQTRIYVNGVQQGQATVSNNFNETTPMYIGANRVAASPFFGYIDDLRITKGVARYTANFTPPALAFPNK